MIFKIIDLEPISQYAYLSSNKRFVTKRGKEWKKEYQRQLQETMEVRGWSMNLSENIECEIEMTFCNKRKNDLDNAVKEVLDCMQGIVISDDRYITKLIISKTYCKKYYGMCNINIKIK